MAKTGTVFNCSECGGESLRWAGQCPHCRAWNSLEEATAPRRGESRLRQAAVPIPITEIPEDSVPRLGLRWDELNRVLGGGIVKGSLVLLSGEPGVGKSTLLMEVASQLASRGHRVLYVSGEESAQQVRMRAARLEALEPGILILSENDLGSVLQAIEAERPALAIVDSIQTVYDAGLESAAGSVAQVRESAGRLMQVAKAAGVSTILTGHVTKEGAIAGPRVLEHVVDVVLYLEGERSHSFRVLRSTKNRFGSTDEIGIFAMTGGGLEEVPDASTALLGDSSLTAGGTVVLATVEGTRPLLVELQSLVSPTPFGLPRRSANGVDANRLHMIVAILEKRAGLVLRETDIFVNVAGGIRVAEPAADLGVALSIAGNHPIRPLTEGTVVIGELGLTGEVRRVGQLDRRLAEAVRHGFTRAIIPSGSAAGGVPGIELVEVRDLQQAIACAFSSPVAAVG